MARGSSWIDELPGTADTFTVTATLVGDQLTLVGTYDVDVPYFGWVFNRPIRGDRRRRLEQIVRELNGQPPAPEGKQPWWAPPTAMSADEISMVATVTFLLAITEYGSGLLTQTLDYVAHTFHATNAQLGVVAAVTRVGNLIVLVGGLMTDRIGRRRLLLWSVVTTLVATGLAGIAPNLVTWGALQVFVNGASNLAFLVGFIAAVEEAPEAARTYTLAIVGLGAGLGFAAGAVALPFADTSPGAWRVLYLAALPMLLAVPNGARRLAETRRFNAVVERGVSRGRMSEVVDERYGSRFFVLAIAGFLLSFFFAPQAQFNNRYLRNVRHMNGGSILLLRAVAQAVPGVAATYFGGKSAEERGRKPTARIGLLIGVAAGVGGFLMGGPLLWVFYGVAAVGLSFAGPALGSFSTELFPTEVRGTAGAGLTIIGVLGSASGLLVAGFLSSPLHGIGKAVAITAIGPLIVGLFLISRLPEARGQLLDDVSPTEG